MVLAGPVVAGIHAGDPARMSVSATFPELRAWERGHGSLIRGAKAANKAGRKDGRGAGPLFATVDGGLDRLVEALASAGDRMRTLTGMRVDRIEPGVDAPYVVVAGQRRLLADAVIVATPAAAASAALAGLAPDSAPPLHELRTVSTATVTFVYPPGTADRLPDATGLLVPARSPADTLDPSGPQVVTAFTWLSRKWPRPDFGDRAVVRCFVGRDGDEAALGFDDDSLGDAAAADVERTTPMGAAPEATLVSRWPGGMPQYDVGHLARVAAATDALAAAAPGVFVAGAAYGGIGIADCVRQGGEAAGRVRAFLDARRTDGAPNGRPEEATSTR
jgi:oxygen-dependent protoporphyrinogen oxidase